MKILLSFEALPYTLLTHSNFLKILSEELIKSDIHPITYHSNHNPDASPTIAVSPPTDKDLNGHLKRVLERIATITRLANAGTPLVISATPWLIPKPVERLEQDLIARVEAALVNKLLQTEIHHILVHLQIDIQESFQRASENSVRAGIGDIILEKERLETRLREWTPSFPSTEIVPLDVRSHAKDNEAMLRMLALEILDAVQQRHRTLG